MSDTKQEIYKNSAMKSIHIALAFFVLIIVLTIGLYFYNSSLEGDISDIKTEITQKEVSIKAKQENKLVQVYDLYTLNKQILERLSKYSEITTYMDELDKIGSIYNLIFKGFDYSNWVLSVEATTVSNERGLDYQKTANFIKKYRASEKALFTLDFVDTIKTEADKQIFDLTFNVK